jgi:hypothetical protein
LQKKSSWRRRVAAAAIGAGFTVLASGAAVACDCGRDYHYRHHYYGSGNYSCYGGGYDCRYEDSGYYYRDDFRDGYRYDGHRYDDRYRRYDRDYRGRDDRW